MLDTILSPHKIVNKPELNDTVATHGGVAGTGTFSPVESVPIRLRVYCMRGSEVSICK